MLAFVLMPLGLAQHSTIPLKPAFLGCEEEGEGELSNVLQLARAEPVLLPAAGGKGKGRGVGISSLIILSHTR